MKKIHRTLRNSVRTAALIFSVAAILFQLFAATAVYADFTCAPGTSKLDCSAIANGWTEWIPDTCPASTSGVLPPLTGNDNISKEMNFFISKGLTPTQAAAIIGNLEQESGPGTNPLVTNSIGAYGIAQWLGGRKAALQALPNNQTLEVQLKFLWDEVTIGSEKDDGALAALKSDTTLAQMVEDWTFKFERPGAAEANVPRRVQYAQDVLKGSYGASAGAPTSTSTTATALGTSCGNSFTSDSGVTIVGGTGCAGGKGSGKFIDDNKKVLTATNGTTVQQMCQRAIQLSNSNSTLFHQWWSTGLNGACANASGPGFCNTGWCDYTASFTWGYPASGHLLASHNDNTPIAGMQWHWNDLLSRPGVTHPYDRHPPVGAFLFYNNHARDPYSGLPSGHIVVYLGGNTVLSSDFSNDGTTKDGYIGVVAADRIETYWGQEYLGWADPVI